MTIKRIGVDPVSPSPFAQNKDQKPNPHRHKKEKDSSESDRQSTGYGPALEVNYSEVAQRILETLKFLREHYPVGLEIVTNEGKKGIIEGDPYNQSVQGDAKNIKYFVPVRLEETGETVDEEIIFPDQE